MARELGASGIELYESGAYPEASQQLEHAYRYYKVPTTGLWSARALEKTGDLIGAEARYAEVLAMPASAKESKVFVDARREANQELEFVRSRIPRLVIRLNAASAEQVAVTIDDVVVPSDQIGAEIRVNPGVRRIVGTLGERVERVTLDMPERSTGSAVLDFTPRATTAAIAEPSPQPTVVDTSDATRKTWGYVALGVGGAGLVTGVVATVLASGQREDLDASCPDQACTPEHHGAVDTLNDTLTLSLIGYLGAVAGIGVGSYLLFTATDESGSESSRSPSSTLSVWIGPGSAAVSGRF